MDFEITPDASWECRVGETLQGMHLHEEFHHFLADNYGDGVPRLFVVMNCHAPTHPHETRIFFDQSRKTLYMDVMLNFELMRAGGVLQRRKHILTKLGEDVPAVAARYASSNFDGLRFGRDFRDWTKNYPDFPVPNEPTKRSGTSLQSLEAVNGEFRKIVLEEFGPLMSRLGLSFSSEWKGEFQHAVAFDAETKGVAVLNEIEPGALAVQSSPHPQTLRNTRLFILQYVNLEHEGCARLRLTSMESKEDKLVALIPLPTAGDFRLALKAVAVFFGNQPSALFPQMRSKNKPT